MNNHNTNIKKLLATCYRGYEILNTKYLHGMIEMGVLYLILKVLIKLSVFIGRGGAGRAVPLGDSDRSFNQSQVFSLVQSTATQKVYSRA